MLQGLFDSPSAHKPKSTNGDPLSIIHGGSTRSKTGWGEVAIRNPQFFADLFEHLAEERTTSFPQSAVISLINHFTQSLNCTRVPNQYKLIYTKLSPVFRVGHTNCSKWLTESQLPGRDTSVCFSFSNSPGLNMQKTPISSKVAKTRHLLCSRGHRMTEE